MTVWLLQLLAVQAPQRSPCGGWLLLPEAKRTLAYPEAAVLSILEQALPVFCSSSSCWPARGAKKNTLHGMWKCGYKRVVPFPS